MTSGNSETIQGTPDSANPQPVLIGTAGHIDHGKTTLVLKLTGVNTDRLPEEQARGISIDLGFAHFDCGGFRFGIVDVPGHERFIRQMVAGAANIDLALLVVAADDGVMPQTREHLEILQLLGVQAGVIAVTRSDAVYPDLAFSYDLRSMLRDTHQRRSEVVIAVSPIAYLSRYAWPVKDAAVFERYFDQLCTFICELISLGNTVLLFSTDTCDRHVVADLMARLSTKGELVKEGRLLLAYPDSPRELLEKLVNVDLVVASRLHGVLLSHLLSLPVMAISYDRKVDTYMQDMGMADYCVDIHKLDAKLLSTKFEALRLNQQDIRSQLAEKKAVYARDLQAQYERVLSRMIFISA